MDKINIILLIGCNHNSKQIFLDNLKNKFNFSYIKLEDLIPVISDTINSDVSKEQYINFINTFINKLENKDEMYVIDVNNCKKETLNIFINNKKVFLISLDCLFNIDNFIYVDVNKNLDTQLYELERKFKTWLII